MEVLDFLFYFIIFIMGSVFGSFFSLAIYRLPRKEDITHVRSHCTSCDHRLNLIDLIPIWSYIFLGGKCRYCKEKIRPRYLLLEIFSGLVFVLIAIMYGINSYSSLTDIISLAFIYLFLCALFIIGGIDNENYIIHNGTLIYGIIISLCFGLFKAFFLSVDMKYQLVGFLLIPTILTIISIILKTVMEDEKLPWGFGDIKYLSLIGLFMGFGNQMIVLILATVIACLMCLIKKYRRIPFGYFLSIASVIVLIFANQIAAFSDMINFSMI